MSKKDNEIDTSPLPINNLSQPSTLNPLPFQIFSVSDIEAVPLSKATAPIIASFLISLLIIYSIFTLLLIAILWIVIEKKKWPIYLN